MADTLPQAPGGAPAMAARPSRRIEAAYPLTSAQEGMLYQSILDRTEGAYVSQAHWTIDGALDTDALRAAWDAVLAHHSALRAGFSWSRRARPIQAIAASLRMPWLEIDLCGLPAAEQLTRFDAMLAADRARGFDPRRPPLMRVTLVRYAEHRHELLWTAHHILLDGWSTAIVLRDVHEAYAAIASGGQPSLKATRPFREFVEWLESTPRETARAHWARVLDNFPGATEPALSRPAAGSSPGGDPYMDVVRHVAPDVSAAVREFASRNRFTESTVVLGAWCATLARYADRDRVALGVTLAGRPPSMPGVDNIVGPFITTVPMVVDARPETRFPEWLAAIQRDIADAQRFGHLPAAAQREAAGIPAHEPLFECLFAFENYPDAPADESPNSALGLTIGELRGVDRPEYALNIVVAPGQRLRLLAIADGRRYARESIERLLEHLERALVAIVSGRADTLFDIEILGATERTRSAVLAGAAAPYPRDASLFSLFEQRARERPAADAIAASGVVTSYGALESRARRIHAGLRARGVKPGDRVAIVLERGADFVAAMLGVLRAGAVYVPIDPATPAARTRFIIADTAARVSIVEAGQGSATADYAHAVPLDVLEALDDEALAPVATDGGALAYIMYTSGSTGSPKGVAVPQRAVSRLVVNSNFLTLPGVPRIGFASNTAFDASTLELWAALALGGTLVTIDRGTLLDASTLAATLARAPLDLLWLTAGLFGEIVRASPGAFSSVGTLMVGGDVVDPAAVRAVRVAGGPERILNGYGPTENTTFTTTCDLTELPETATTAPLGRPIANTTVRVLDRHGRPVPRGVAGELYAGGDGLAIGYHARAALTAERFVPDAWGDRPGERLYRTGDLVRVRGDGVLEFLGRADEQVKVRGFRVEPAEIEAALVAIPGVARALVVVEGDGAADRRLVAYAAGENIPTPSALRDRLSVELPSYMVPTVIVPLREFPLTANGKVDRRALSNAAAAAAALGSHGDGAERRDASPTVAILAGIWAALLGVDAVVEDDDFFQLGGHSLTAMQLAARARDAFGVSIPLRVIFDAPVLRDLARELDHLRAGVRLAAPTLAALARPREIPLSFAQQRLWFLDRFAPLSAAYHVPHAIRLHGAVDAEALARSLTDLCARHETLRTVFPRRAGRAVQVVLDDTHVPLDRVDLSGRAPAARDRALSEVLERQFATPFDLAAGPLIRTALIRLSDAEYVFAVTLHHIVADGWSLDVFSRELSACYAARLAGATHALPPLAVQYADFALWQREWLTGDTLEAALDHWRGTLGGAPITELPGDRPRPATQSFRGDTLEVSLPRELVHRVASVARAHDCTPFMLLLAAYAAFVARLSGAEDVVIGVPIAGRTRAELEPLIGFFVNMLPVRVRVPRSGSFASLVAAVRAAALDAYDHQDVPFESIVDALKPPRDPSRQPIVQLTFAVHDFAGQELALPGVRVGDVRADLHWVRVDAELHFWPSDEGMRGYWAFATDLFDRTSIAAHHDRFVRLVDSALRDPARAVANLHLLGDEDVRSAERANATAAPFESAATLHDLIYERAAAHPQLVASIDATGPCTYAALRARSDAIARALVRHGVRLDATVAVVLDRGHDLIASMLGVLVAGAAYAPIDPALPSARIRHLLRVASPTVILTDAEHEASLGDAAALAGTVLLVDALTNDTGPAAIAMPRTDAGQGAYVIFTSGSTGVPKGVLVSHRALVNHMTWMQTRFPLEPADRVLQKTSVTFDASVWEFWAPLLAGAAIVFAEPTRHSDARHLVEMIERHAVSTIQLVPSVAELLVREPGFMRCSSLRRVFLGGEALDWSLVDRLHDTTSAEVINLYGPAEATIDATYAVWPRGASRAHRPIGAPIANVQAFVLDAALTPVPPGIPGELYLGGEGLARGYLGQPAQTAERFVPNPFAANAGARMYRTGDIVRRLADGALEYIGRADAQVKIRGQRTEPGEVEALLRSMRGVREAAVAAAPDHESLVAWVTLDDSTPLSSDEATADAGTAGTSEGEAAGDDGARVAQWHALYEQIYADDGDPRADAAFDIRGWNDSATGTAIPAEEMRRWLDTTLARVLALRPRRVLEIGAGSGLVLFGVAPHVEGYVATDFADAAIARLRGLTQGPRFAHVALATADGASSAALVDEPVDLTILNSVIQYFPSTEYLALTLARAAAVTAPGGRIFIGDVRALAFLEGQLAEVELQRAAPELSLDDLRRRVRQRRRIEEELLLDPAFFTALRARIPRIARVEVQLKRGHDYNELVRFRYDVVLHLDRAPDVAVGDELTYDEWRGVADLESRMAAHRPARVHITGIPNARVAGALATAAGLADARLQTVADLRAHAAAAVNAVAVAPAVAAVEPEALWLLGDRLGYDVAVAWGESAAHVEVSFSRRDAPLAPAPTLQPPTGAETVARPLHMLAHDPAHVRRQRAAPAALRASLEALVPLYMVPSAIVCLDTMPLTPNGKIDRRALPAPDVDGLASLDELVRPSTDAELLVAALWREILEIDQIDVRDDFFVVGGSSLSVVVLAAAIRDRAGVELSVAQLFAARTIRDQALALTRARSDEAAAVTGVRLGAGPRTVFCFPPLAGYGLAFHALAANLVTNGEGSPTHGGGRAALHAFDFPAAHPAPLDAFADAVHAAQPEGPLVLLGYSAGGPVALEVAKVLAARGRVVSDLIVIDAAVVDERARLDDDALEGVIEENLAYFADTVMSDPALRDRFGHTSGRNALAGTMRAYARFLDGLRHEGGISAAVHVVRAGDRTPDESARQPWSRHTTGPVRSYDGYGPHVDMLTGYAAQNARVLDAILEQVYAGDPQWSSGAQR